MVLLENIYLTSKEGNNGGIEVQKRHKIFGK